MSIRTAVTNPFSKWMDGSGPDSDVVVSSRVRVARNLAALPFPHLMSAGDAEQVLQAVAHSVGHQEVRRCLGQVELVRLGELTAAERQILVEKHLISPDLLNKPEFKAVVLDAAEVVSIMVNEEDHLRLQCLLPGLQLSEAWQIINRTDDALEKTLEYAFDEKLGYLTACPTNVGTGMRASVMLHLPGLVMVNQIKGVLASIGKLGLTVRGLYGEGTEAAGNMFQISNQVTLGLTEEDIIANLLSITGQIIASERAARQALLKEMREQLEDRICRAYGLLRHARIMSSEEAMRLLSELRLGISLQIVDYIPLSLVTGLMVQTRPAFLLKLAGRELTTLERDVFRAQLIRERLKPQA
ncbi:MAG: protein arginine kinase [Desulfurispora sp.]|uniref:protein arginine kinase n=1 Tax=Desulfurispora sp. TaxID=3014275 RepID=UPI0040494E13